MQDIPKKMHPQEPYQQIITKKILKTNHYYVNFSESQKRVDALLKLTTTKHVLLCKLDIGFYLLRAIAQGDRYLFDYFLTHGACTSPYSAENKQAIEDIWHSKIILFKDDWYETLCDQVCNKHFAHDDTQALAWYADFATPLLKPENAAYYLESAPLRIALNKAVGAITADDASYRDLVEITAQCQNANNTPVEDHMYGHGMGYKTRHPYKDRSAGKNTHNNVVRNLLNHINRETCMSSYFIKKLPKELQEHAPHEHLLKIIKSLSERFIRTIENTSYDRRKKLC